VDLGEAVIVAGIGCRKGATADEIAAAIAAALARAGLDAVDLIATPAIKGGEPGIAAAAAKLGIPLVLVPPAELEAASPRTVTRSERVVQLMGVPSVAETAALAAAGPTARLITPRTVTGPATCALAETESGS
jgi:cobalt-precorrin 5A hydrolase